MEKKLKPQLSNQEDIRQILQEIDMEFVLDDGRTIDTLLIYLPCISGKCDHTDLLRVIKESIMAHFVLSYSEIEAKLSLNIADAPDLLFKKAVRKLSQHTAKGEIGELLLFALLDVYFQAPKILSKISLKTSRRVPVFGADAVHAQYVNNSIRLYLGESKLRKNFDAAATSAAESISSYIDKYRDEFDLIDSYIDFPEMDDNLKNELIDLLNPFTDLDNEILHAPCFIGFCDPDIFSDDEDDYLNRYTEMACKNIGSFYDKLETEGIDINKTALMLLPFSSLDSLVEDFISYMEIES
ncbi:MAG: DUF1837 domain-containing protein [Candidatus Thiodiazotropha sp.]